MRPDATGDPGPAPPGVALPVVLLLLLALTGLAQGGLALARGSILLARARAARLRAGLLAEAALRVAGSELAGLERRQFPLPGGTRARAGLSPAPGLESRIVHRRLDREWHLLGAEATVRAPRGEARESATRVTWILDPDARIAGVRGAVEHGGRLELREGAAIDASSFVDLPEGWPSGICAPFRAALDSVASRGGIRPVARIPDRRDPAEDPPAPSDPYAGAPGIGLLSASALAELAGKGGERTGPARSSASVEPCGPPERGGSPTAPETAQPCGARFRLSAVPGDLTLEGADRRGILLVGGDLRLGAGTTVQGILLVGGDLEVTGASRVLGWVRVRGGVGLRGGARIRASGCGVGVALDRVIPRAPPVDPSGGSWLAPH